MDLKLRDTHVQEIYARWLDAATRIGFLVCVATLALYVSGAVAPFVPLADLPRLWQLPVERYLAATGAPTGWGWVALLERGDYLNYAGIAIFALATSACYLRALPALLARGERLYAAIAALELLVLLGAASGLVC